MSAVPLQKRAAGVDCGALLHNQAPGWTGLCAKSKWIEVAEHRSQQGGRPIDCAPPLRSGCYTVLSNSR
jgi:hypothetical protein